MEMDRENLIKGIKKLKEEKNAFILAHNYQIPDIQELADFVADSLIMARKGSEVENEILVVCGADFMAETAKIVNPGKTVLLPDLDARCPMAGMLKPEDIEDAKKKHPNAKVVLYVNSSAECRAMADITCTSANAADIVKHVDSDEVLFGPDCNLAKYVERKTGKKVIPIPHDGFCYAHKKFDVAGIKEMKNDQPEAILLVHPEADLEIQDIADFIGSTSQMLKYAKESKAKEFIIGTETGLIHQLQKQNPEKMFFPGNVESICYQQKKIGLMDLYNSLLKEQFVIEIDEKIREKAELAINKMLKIK